MQKSDEYETRKKEYLSSLENILKGCFKLKVEQKCG